MSAKCLTVAAMLRIQQMLQAKAHTYDDIQAATKLNHWVVAPYIQELRSFKAVYVAGWAPARNGALIVPRFAWGNKPDVPRPSPLTAAQRMAKSRAARKKKE